MNYRARLRTKESWTVTSGPSSGHSESWYWPQSSHPTTHPQWHCHHSKIPCFGSKARVTFILTDELIWRLLSHYFKLQGHRFNNLLTPGQQQKRGETCTTQRIFYSLKALLLNVFECDWTCKPATYLSIDITRVKCTRLPRYYLL